MGMMRKLPMGGSGKKQIGTLFSTNGEHPNGTPLPTSITMVEGLTYHFIYTGNVTIASTATKWPFYLYGGNNASLFGCRFMSKRLCFLAYAYQLTSNTYSSGLTLTSAELIVTMRKSSIVYSAKINGTYVASNIENTRYGSSVGIPTFTTYGNLEGNFEIISTKE